MFLNVPLEEISHSMVLNLYKSANVLIIEVYECYFDLHVIVCKTAEIDEVSSR